MTKRQSGAGSWRMAAGVNPKSLSAVDLLQRRVTIGQKLVNYGQWVHALRKVIDPASKLPIVADAIVRVRADGSQDVTAPPNYRLESFAGTQVAVHGGDEGVFRALTDESWMRKGAARNAVMWTVGTSKHAVLLFDTFHLGRLAFWNAVVRHGIPTYQRGLTLLDTTESMLKDMVVRGELSAEDLPALIEQRKELDGYLKAGLNIGSIGDNIATHFVQSIPGIGTFNKWLFGKYQRGAAHAPGAPGLDPGTGKPGSGQERKHPFRQPEPASLAQE